MSRSSRVSKRDLGVAWYALALFATSGACSDVLGIEERSFKPEESLCERYCTAVEACTGDFTLYASRDVCLATCARMPQGTDQDKTGNTVGCRLNQALEAAKIGELDVHCPAAGPGGDGVCGTNCEGYCTLMVPVCGTSYFEDVARCLEECESIPSTGVYSIAVPLENSIECRLYHLTSSTLDPTNHCDHAGGVCKCVEGGSTNCPKH